MKNSLLFLLILFFIVVHLNLTADESYQKPNNSPKINNLSKYEQPRNSRTAPGVEFSIYPTEITSSYNNYMIGGKYSPPIVRQPELTSPTEFQAGGIYTSFMYQENPSTPRRVYYSYIDDGNPSSAAPIGNSNIQEGYMSMAIDPVTANPLIVRQGDFDGDELEEVILSYDSYNMVGATGIWNEFTILDDDDPELTGYEHFQNPVIKIGVSPQEDHRRAHVFAQARVSDLEEIYTTVYGYADFYWDEENYSMVFSDWSFRTIPLLDTWQVEEGKWVKKNFAVSDHDELVIFAGFTEDEYFFLVSNDYGQTFETQQIDGKMPIENPQNEDGSYYFTNEDGSPSYVYMVPSIAGGHFNIQLTHFGVVVFPSAMGITTEEALENGEINYEYFYPKIFRYDSVQHQFSFVDIQTAGVDPYDDQPAIPWDLDEDGEVDEYYEDDIGTVYFAESWPSYYFGGDYIDGSLNESTFYLSADSYGYNQVLIFQDSRKHRQAYLENEDYLEWYEKSEIAVCYSADGLWWSDVAYLNANPTSEDYYSELNSMNPCYIYPVDELEWVEGGIEFEPTLNVPIMFYDSYSYFNDVTPPIEFPGTIIYAQLTLNPGNNSSPEDAVLPSEISLSNYPNPFNPETIIKYEIIIPGDVTLEVFNPKGQKIRTLINDFRAADEYEVSWNGKDNAGNSCASGLYFYKLKTSSQTRVKKMILMK